MFPRNDIWRFEYDCSNRRSKEIKPRGEQTGYQYDSTDNLTELTHAKGQRVVNEYDDAGRLTFRREYPAPAGRRSRRSPTATTSKTTSRAGATARNPRRWCSTISIVR